MRIAYSCSQKPRCVACSQKPCLFVQSLSKISIFFQGRLYSTQIHKNLASNFNVYAKYDWWVGLSLKIAQNASCGQIGHIEVFRIPKEPTQTLPECFSAVQRSLFWGSGVFSGMVSRATSSTQLLIFWIKVKTPAPLKNQFNLNQSRFLKEYNILDS